MPFALGFAGLIIMIAAIRGKHDDLFKLIKDDFTGSNNFFVWVLAVVFLVMLGNIERLRPLTNAFLVLMILVIVVANGKKGLFDNFISQLKEGTS